MGKLDGKPCFLVVILDFDIRIPGGPGWSPAESISGKGFARHGPHLSSDP